MAQLVESKAVLDYLSAVRTQRESTYKATRTRLIMLPTFIKDKYGLDADTLLKGMKQNRKDPYVVLSEYATYVSNKGKSADRIRKLVQSARLMFEFHGIDYNPRLFKQRVKLPRAIKREKHATDRAEITDIIQKCHDKPLELALLWHAATGRRPEEIFSLRHCDLDFGKQQYHIRGEFTKMAIEHVRPMTYELASRTQAYIAWKHRHRKIARVIGVRKDGTSITTEIDVKPQLRPTDLLFAEYRRDDTWVDVKPLNLYDWFTQKLGAHLDRIGKGARTSSRPGAPRKFTFYRLRDHTKTTISDLGFGDFAEWYIGHSGSTYYNQPESKRMELFKKVEPYLTYLDVSGLEAHGAAVESKIQEDRQVIETMQKQMAKMEEDHKRDMEELRALIVRNPKLGNVKPDELLKEARKGKGSA